MKFLLLEVRNELLDNGGGYILALIFGGELCSCQVSDLFAKVTFFSFLREISHTVPDISIHGNLSSVHCSLDLYKYKLIRGLLENNLGEPIEEFMRPYDLQDPRIHVSETLLLPLTLNFCSLS